MKVLNEVAAGGKSGNTFVLILTKEEAQTLVDIAEAAFKANKRKATFRRWWKNLDERLECY